MSESYNWKCPYCHTQTTIVPDTNASSHIHYYKSASKFGHIGLRTAYIVCPNSECKELVIKAFLYDNDAIVNRNYDFYLKEDAKPVLSWDLRPQSSSIPLPDYIPEQIINDYKEACSILKLSPKASATLARRCLQGMIRDFWQIKKGTLFDEINELEKQNNVDASTIKAINAIREIGNIGAHMEKDVNIIVDIDAGEAELLIKLLEDLFEDWYITRHEREERNKALHQLAQSKQAAKAESP
jgi:DNA-binding PadR family transcriptional regulator